MNRRIATTSILLLFIFCIAWRISEVNSKAREVEVVTYEVGEEVAMGNDFLFDEQEPSRNYSFIVHGAEIMTPNEFLKQYATDGVMSIDSVDSDDDSVIVLDMTIRNKGAEQGGIDAFLWQIVPEEKNIAYRMDTELSGHIAAPLETGMISVRPGGESRTHIAFSSFQDMPYLNSSSEYRRAGVMSKSFHIAFTMRPERKIVEFEAR